MKRLAVIHTLGRSGGTLIAKVVGCMDRIVLLSEIHPQGPQTIWHYYGRSGAALALQFHPVFQAKEWHGVNLSRSEHDTQFTPSGSRAF